MNELRILLSGGPFTLTAYGLCVAVGALLAIVMTVLMGRGRLGIDGCLSMSLAAGVGAILGARMVYCLTMLDFILYDMGGAEFIPQLWQGGYSLYGAVLGGMLGVWLYARATRRKTAQLLDLAAPGAALAIAVIRSAEYFTGQGLGHYIDAEEMMRFPFAVESLYGDWQMPVFFYEAVAAVIILAVVLAMRRHGCEGCMAETFIILLGLTQIILESWREDEFIRFGFVRFNQLAAAITLGVVLALRILRQVKENGLHAWQIIRGVLFLAGIGIIIALEFALDKSSIDNTILYGMMAAALIVMGISLLKNRHPKKV